VATAYFSVPLTPSFFIIPPKCSSGKWVGQNNAPQAARQLVADLAGQDFDFDEEKSLFLLSFFANAERAKDNAPLLAQLLSTLFDRAITIQTVDYLPSPAPVARMGQTRLGTDSILAELPLREATDWLVEIAFEQSEELAAAVVKDNIQKVVIAILEYFVLATRAIHVVVKALPEAHSPWMGQGILGINLQLSN
jgi:hypothetical protein